MLTENIHMISITPKVRLDNSEIQFSFIRSPGPGGQNVNKVATAVLLRFNLAQSPSLPEEMRSRLLVVLAPRLTQSGEIIIKATRFRTQERNKQDALARLQELLARAAIPPKKRKKTKPSYASKQRRLDTKKIHGKTKLLRRGKPGRDE
jgi:ribosome-associated protein